MGFHVGVFKSEMNYHVGNWASSGTRRNRAAYKKRQLIEKRNTRYHIATYVCDKSNNTLSLLSKPLKNFPFLSQK